MAKRRLRKAISAKPRRTGRTTAFEAARSSSVPYLPSLLERLRDSDYAAGYLSECLSDSVRTFLVGLRDVVAARGGIASVAKEASISREHLYRLLSENGNPRLTSLTNVLAALGIHLTFAADSGREAA